MEKMQILFSDDIKLQRVISRFWPKVNKGLDTGCWEWQGLLNSNGYGLASVQRGFQVRAHRLSFSLKIGRALLMKEFLLHSCDNPKCVNPDHLRVGTQRENILDCINRGRKTNPPTHFGEDHHNSKFLLSDLNTILNDKRPYRLIAKDYGVCEETIGRVKRKQTWKLQS